MHFIKFLIVFVVLGNPLLAQHDLPVLKTNTKVLSIKDGEELRADYWTIDPNLSLDIYEANKTQRKKNVVFYSDIDSISFELLPHQHYDFLVVYNGIDTCKTQLKSGIRLINTTATVLDQDTIPFVLTSANNIIIQTILNEKDTLDLMFHTAQNAISLTEEAVKKIQENGFDKTTRSQSWGGTHDARYSNGNKIRIKDFEWNNITLWEDKNSGPSSDGKFGPHLFENKVVELNFDESIMVIHSYMPEVDKSYQKTDLLFRRNGMYLDTKYKIDGKDYDNIVLIHSGYGGTILLDNHYVITNGISEKLSLISESQLKDSYGNILKTKKVKLPYLAVGDEVFTEIPISFFEGIISNQSISVMGGDLIKRFNIFFDLQQAEIYFKANKLYSLPFENS